MAQNIFEDLSRKPVTDARGYRAIAFVPGTEAGVN